MSSNPAKLQIKLLSPAGQLLNCINCYSGQVSVFRAASPSELQPYLRVLGGTPGPEQLIVSIDDENYRAESCILIGYGERFLTSDGSAAQFLARNRVPEDSIEPILLAYGLENVFHTQCTLLSKCEERRLRLIAATYDPTAVMVLNSPFDPITSAWREKFAELIISCARMRKKIVVVPYLAYRPECWIDNDCVARIQVGDNIQKTVGFKNKNEELGSLLKQIRSSFGEEATSQELIKADMASDENVLPVTNPVVSGSAENKVFASDTFRGPAIRSERFPAGRKAVRRADEEDDDEAREGRKTGHGFGNLPLGTLGSFLSRPRLALATVFIAITLVTGFSLASKQFFRTERSNETALVNTPSQQNVPSDQTQNLESPLMQIPQDDADVASVNEAIQPPALQPQPEKVIEAEPPVVMAKALDLYPPNIRSAILATFDQRSPQKTSNHKIEKPVLPQKQEKTDQNELSGNEAGEFLRLLEFAGNENDTASEVESEPIGSNHANNVGGSSEDERREQIRQKFLEAIQRAQDRRNVANP